MSFYQKYRPKKISELDLAGVRDSLLAVLKSGKVSHAYLFVGPRGAGKTSTARILAQLVNCKENDGRDKDLVEPCGKCEACLAISKGSSVDVIEIDAASSGLVDDIRDLREKVRLSPAHLKKKVYIIDEVHMVSTAGFNALLKTLEEPPAHALFILCTTEAQKVPETIVSRCAKVSFTKATVAEVVRSLHKAVEGEKLEIDDATLDLIASSTDGSFREGHKILEQLATRDRKIDIALVSEVLGISGKQAVGILIGASLSKDTKAIIDTFNDLEKRGIKAQNLANELLLAAKEGMEKNIGSGEAVYYMRIIAKLIDAAEKVRSSPLPLLPLETALLSFCFEAGRVSENARVDTPEEKVQRQSNPGVRTESPKMILPIEAEKEEEKHNVVVQAYSGPLASLDQVKNGWHDFLTRLAPINQSLAGLLRAVEPVDIQGKSLTLNVFYKFHKDQLEQDAKRKVVEEMVAKTWGPMSVRCVLGERGPKRFEPIPEDANVTPVSPTTEAPIEKGVMAAAEEIFGN